MNQLVDKLIVYRKIAEDSILHRMGEICRDWKAGTEDAGALNSRIYDQVNRLLDVGTTYGFDGDMWACYIAYLLANTITPFTLVAEKTGAPDGSVNRFVMNDFHIFRTLVHYDFGPMEEDLGIDCFSVLRDYHAVVKSEQIFNREVSAKVRELAEQLLAAEDDVTFYDVVTDFYRRYGVGKLGLNKAFRIAESTDGELLVPVTNTADVRLEDLVGYEIQKQRLVENTEAFLAGRKANNVLLYGDAGTGKSTSVKAILNQYYEDGLRMIEVYKHQFRDLSAVINEIKNRNYRFILYMDDLSFEEFEIEYKYLKAVIEGGIEPYPENVLIYATSNRRHLIRETFRDKRDESDDDLHRNDTVQEKRSLANRFGLSIGFFSPTPQEYDTIVRELAARYPQIQMPEEELIKQARAWELRHGGYSGRTAQQFINYLAGVTYAEDRSL